ncbi:hypothetical protein N656DRAFT_802776 [Canariomyces notabilis]|uniref:Uncharacterized protein n=1 Tax=Canariomyces notabilis TaxID=2074819 RepID=A0AAN6QBR1_9PEZI|nr:hypothetical protein N656DRAFT_802776 [Canariomyces arenarius]
MDFQAFRRRHSRSAILLNLVAVLSLAVLLGLAIVVSDMDTHIAFSGFESRWNRVPNGLEQLLSGRIPPERASILLLMFLTAFTSTATVALFSAQTAIEDLTNDRPSLPLEPLPNRTWSDFNCYGICYIDDIAPALGSFMYRSAYVNGLISGRSDIWEANDRGQYRSMTPDGLLGDVMYRGLWTAGVGLSVRSYAEYLGPGEYFSLPDNYTLNALRGEVYGTIINSTCENRTADYDRYSEYLWELGGMVITTVTRREPGKVPASVGDDSRDFDELTRASKENITAVSHRGYKSFDPDLAIGSNITYPNPVKFVNATGGSDIDLGEPVHVILVAGPVDKEGQVFECRYSGQEVLVETSLESPVAPVEIGRVMSTIASSTTSSQSIWLLVKQLVAEELHNNMELVARGFRNGGYFPLGDGYPAFEDTALGDMLALVLSQSAQAAISLLRQTTEVAYMRNPPEVSPAASIAATISFQRLGGKSRGWLVVYGVLLLGSLIGLVRTLIGGRAVEFEAQDAAVLLAKAMGDEEFGSATRRYTLEKEVVQRDGRGSGEIPQGDPDRKQNPEDAASPLIDRT